MPALIPSNTRCLAIVMPSWIGDTVMATPVLRAARQALPDARIVGVMRPGLDDILRGTPWLDEVVVCDMKGVLGPLRLGCAIRSSRADAVLLLPNSFRTALGTRLSGAKTRVGYDRDHRGWLLTHRMVSPDQSKPMPAVDYYAALAEWALGMSGIDRRIELATTEQELKDAARLLSEVGGRFILLNPGANRPDKRWPAERFAAAGDAIAAAHDVKIVVSGSPKERLVLDDVRRESKSPIVDLSERGVTLGSLKAVIQRAALVVTNDTGPRHIAAALGTPVVTLFGPTDHRWTTLCGVRERIILAEPFLPEDLVADRYPKACAIEKIAVRDVTAAVNALLAQTLDRPSSPALASQQHQAEGH